MAPQFRPSKEDISSIKYWWVPLEVQHLKRDVVCCKGDDYPHPFSPIKCCLRSADPSGISKVASIGYSSDVANTHGSISRKDQVRFIGIDCNGISESCITGKIFTLVDLASTLSTERKVPFEGLNSSSGGTINLEENIRSTYSLEPSKRGKDAVVFTHPRYDILLDCNSVFFASIGSAFRRRQQATDSCCKVVKSSSKVTDSKDQSDNKNEKSLFQQLVFGKECYTGYWLLIQDKLQQAFAKNRHALAGALAGTLVTLFLHPVDTVKTVIQANGMGQKSPYYILKTIISEKGVPGLYRGIASNIASSAPISAIYTHTYESVKGVVLPFFPKEYQSFAHCIAGGCSSITSSFIFTPSECIKQQMQVGSQYQNSWNALIGCLEKGGLPSLYAGWVAVLCRNVPHSVIKFYTYESLKQLLTSKNSDACLNTLQMLVCGGLAGSTAALFSTPFDVVKTRLQTQAPGPLAKYNGVLHTLQEIAREEGLQGLYRGLAPRLAVYVSQGAMFFASYEFFKAVLPSEDQKDAILVIAKELKADDRATLRTQNLDSQMGRT